MTLLKQSDPALQWALYNDYYGGGCVGKGGIGPAVQLDSGF